jgi:cyclophilin family peptidyl-prolyl cis-trans isomerase
MLPFISAWTKHFFKRHPELRRRKSGWNASYCSPAEVLEARSMLSITMNSLITNDLPNTKTEFIAASISNTTSNPVTLTATSSNANVTATVLTGGTSIDFNVTGKDSTGTTFTGDIIVRLFDSLTPNTAAHIISLVNSHFYDGLKFHRVIPGFVSQGGDPTDTGSGGSGTGGTVSPIDDEFNTALTYTSNGLMGMANSGHDTNDSQFFFTALNQTLAQLPQHLNFENPIVGIITSGMDIANKLNSVSISSSSSSQPVINSAKVITDTNNGVVEIQSKAGFTGSSTITIKGDDGSGNFSQQEANINVVSDTANDPPILGAVSNQTATQGLPVTFTVTGTDIQKDQLTFVVKDPTSFAASGGNASNPSHVQVQIQVTAATSSTPSKATITLTPDVTFSGTVDMIIGVRDGFTHNSASSINAPSNFDTEKITLTVNPINHAPTSPGGSVVTPVNTPDTIQLTGSTGDPDKQQTLTFINIPSTTTHGTITNVDSSKGTLTYTPNAGFIGVDSFTYQVKDDGGTDNGGVDTSAQATFTITVGAPTLSGLVLSPTSDDGFSNTDNVILNSTPTFTVTSQTATSVTFKVNGTTTVTAKETSTGTFTATLSRSDLQVGTNTITATGTLNGASSDPTSPLTFTYTPSDVSVYTVPGAFGSTQKLTFRWTSRSAAFDNELGVFAVSDASGTVNGIAAGSAGYAAAALSSSTRQILFASGQTAGATRTITVTGGELLAFYLVSNNTTASFLSDNSQNSAGGVNAFFSTQAANPDHIKHFQNTADTFTGRMIMSWEDMLFGGDRDYNDAVITLTPGSATASATIGKAVRISGASTDNVPVTFNLEPTKKTYGPAPSVAKGEIGVITVSDSSGTINGIAPGSAGYLAAALSSSTRQVLFNQGDAIDTSKILQITGGSLVEFYYVPDGTAASVLANNPTNDPKKGPVALFSFNAANPNSSDNFRWFSPEFVDAPQPTTPSGDVSMVLHGSGVLNPTDKDFDDFAISITMPQ